MQSPSERQQWHEQFSGGEASMPAIALEQRGLWCNTQIAYCGYRTYTAFTLSCRQALREVRRSMSASQSLPALELSEPVPIQPRKWLVVSVQFHTLNMKHAGRPSGLPVSNAERSSAPGAWPMFVIEIGGRSRPRFARTADLWFCARDVNHARALTKRLWSAMATGIPSGEHRSLPGRGVPLLYGRRTPCSQQV